MKILWASPHTPTPNQIEELFFYGEDDIEKNEIIFLKYIEPEFMEKIANVKVNDDCYRLSTILLRTAYNEGCMTIAQPAGPGRLQRAYGEALKRFPSLSIIEAHSDRVSEDIKQPDGSIKKITRFNHVKFV